MDTQVTKVAKSAVAIVDPKRAHAYALADNVSKNDTLNEKIAEAVISKELAKSGPLTIYYVMLNAIGDTGMAEFPTLGTNDEGENVSNNPENYGIPAKNDKGESITRPANFYSDYVERLDIVKMCRERMEAITVLLKNGEGDDMELGREYDRNQARITDTRSYVRNCAGLWQQKRAIEELGLTVKFASKKEEDGTEIADGSNKPCTIVDTAEFKFKNLSISSFLSLKPVTAKAEIAKGKAKFDAILATGNKRKPGGENEGDEEGDSLSVSDLPSFTTAIYNAASWMGENETAVLSKITRDLKGDKKDYELLSAIFELHELIAPIVTSPKFEAVYQNYVVNVADKKAA